MSLIKGEISQNSTVRRKKSEEKLRQNETMCLVSASPTQHSFHLTLHSGVDNGLHINEFSLFSLSVFMQLSFNLLKPLNYNRQPNLLFEVRSTPELGKYAIKCLFPILTPQVIIGMISSEANSQCSAVFLDD